MVVGGNKKILCGREGGRDVRLCAERERERECVRGYLCVGREREVCVCIGIRLRV